jgi:thioesterase domain-containing protein/acyl carrier protein
VCLGPDDRIDLLAHPSFSVSLASIFTALLTGAELHVLDARHQFADLGAWLARSGITVSTMSVSTLRALCATLPPGGAPPSLRLISVGGEPLLAKDVAAFWAAFPSSCVLQNAMASTETRTYAQYFVPRASPPDGPTPIGWPVFGKAVEVLGPDGAPVGAGQPGEIAVRSRYLAQGYVNSPSLTADRFLPQPDGSVLFLTGDRGCFRDDGCLTFHGRADSMVKIRGNRVELGAVEAALGGDSEVRQAAVVVRQSAGREPHLVAYVVLEPRAPATADQLLKAVAKHLPAYAVPSALVIVKSLPITRNGKTDYRALKDREIEESPTGPSDGATASLLRIWSEVLGRSDIHSDDSFFECGGDSLDAIRLQVEVRRQFGVDLPLEVLVRHPSVNTFAEWLTDRPRVENDGAVPVLLNQGDNGIPLFCVPGVGGEPSAIRPLAVRLGDRPVYGLRTSSELGGQDLSIETMAAACLRAIGAVITPETPVLLCGHSFGAIVAFEMAHQLRAAGHPLGLLAIIDMPLGAGRRRWWQRVRDVLVNLPAWLRYDALQTDWKTLAVRCMGKVALKWRQMRPAARRARAGAERDFRAYFGKRDVPIEMKQRLTARLNALDRYRLRPFAGTSVLFRARAQALFGRSDRDLGWERLATAVDVCDVPGDHSSCAAEPHVGRMAELLSARLSAVNGS